MCGIFATPYYKYMKKISFIGLMVLVLSSFQLHAQIEVVKETKIWTLEECVRYALANNITIKQTELDSIDANINKRGAIGNFLPTANANANHSWNIGLNQNITTGLLQNQTTQYSAFGASAGVNLYDGLRNLNNLRRAKLAIVASQYQLTKMQEDVALNVANAFLQVIFDKEFLKVQRKQKEINEKQLFQTQEFVDAGSLPKGDLLDVKATIASDTQRVIAAENALLISKLGLAQLLQLKEFYNFDVKDETDLNDENNMLAKTPLSIYENAKEQRTEIKIARTQLEIAMKDLAIAKGSYQPTLNAFFSYDTRISYNDVTYFEGSTLVTEAAPPFGQQFADNAGKSFGASLSIPIFNGFQVRNNVDRAKVEIERRKIALEQEDLYLQRTVYTAYTDALGALKGYESAVAAVESRQGSYDYSKEKYDVGLMNSFDFFQSQSLLTNAQSEVLRTKYDYIFKIKILEFYFGIPISQIMQN